MHDGVREFQEALLNTGRLGQTRPERRPVFPLARLGKFIRYFVLHYIFFLSFLFSIKYQYAGRFKMDINVNVGLDNLSGLNAVSYVLENGCKWRRLPKEFGNRHTIYTRMRRWAKAGVLDGVFQALREEGFLQIRIEAISLDSTHAKVHRLSGF